MPTANKKKTTTVKSSKPKNYQLFAFDLDGTLTKSKEPVAPALAKKLVELLKKKKVVIITGGKFELIQEQILDRLTELAKKLPNSNKILENLYLLAVSGTQYFHYENESFKQIYRNNLNAEQKFRAVEAIMDSALELKMLTSKKYGELIEDRGGQITFSALGQLAPLAKKEKWDPTVAKRTNLARLVQRKLPDLEVRPGGSTSIDVTAINVNKAFGLKRITLLLGVDLKKVIYFGDRFEEFGNDRPVLELGVDVEKVENPTQTLKKLNERLK